MRLRGPRRCCRRVVFDRSRLTARFQASRRAWQAGRQAVASSVCGLYCPCERVGLGEVKLHPRSWLVRPSGQGRSLGGSGPAPQCPPGPRVAPRPLPGAPCSPSCCPVSIYIYLPTCPAALQGDSKTLHFPGEFVVLVQGDLKHTPSPPPPLLFPVPGKYHLAWLAVLSGTRAQAAPFSKHHAGPSAQAPPRPCTVLSPFSFLVMDPKGFDRTMINIFTLRSTHAN